MCSKQLGLCKLTLSSCLLKFGENGFFLQFHPYPGLSLAQRREDKGNLRHWTCWMPTRGILQNISQHSNYSPRNVAITSTGESRKAILATGHLFQKWKWVHPFLVTCTRVTLHTDHFLLTRKDTVWFLVLRPTTCSRLTIWVPLRTIIHFTIL